LLAPSCGIDDTAAPAGAEKWRERNLGKIFLACSVFEDYAFTVRILLNWLLSALSLLIVTRVVPGFIVKGFGTALIAAVVIGLVNATIGLVLKLLTLPLTILTLGIFWLIINALMLMLASALVPGFKVDGFLPAFLGAILLSLVNMLLHWIIGMLASPGSNATTTF
jgi:putative membrane protein